MADQYFGKYTGVVKDNRDDAKLGVLQVSVPTIFPPEELVPARAALPFGVYFVPENETRVWVEFEGGDPEFPLWTGVQHAAGTWAEEAAKNPPTVRAVKTVSGHLLIFDDTEGSESIVITDGKNAHELRFDADGVKLTDGKNGHVIVCDSSGIKVTDGKNSHEIELGASAVNVKHGAGLAKLTLEAASVTAEAGASKMELGAAMAKVDGPVVMLGAGAAPVLHMGDMGVGNLGAPVAITITTQTKVLA
ncbi:phage baseplate assembly protein V [Phytomonospora sp. NPDC050363]|uniref:phage baseplate assembly protein V n=1 Tax=Phytomonospora sp. NPDC050363 TaxID=3155642 RepID=UPI0033E3617B